MATVTFLLGLCGSGKSYLSTKIHDSTGAEEFSDLLGRDDFPRLIEALRSGRDCVVEEIAYCDPAARIQVEARLRKEVPDIKIGWVYFENDFTTANWNSVHRTNKANPVGHLRINRAWHSRYGIPLGVETRPIFRIPGRHKATPLPEVLERFRADLDATLSALGFVEVERSNEPKTFGSGLVRYVGPDAYFRLVWDGKEHELRAEAMMADSGTWSDLETWPCGPGGAGGHGDSSDARADLIERTLRQTFRSE